MEDYFSIPLAIIISILFEGCINNFDISLLSMVLFINIIGLYYITKNLKVEVKISYNGVVQCETQGTADPVVNRGMPRQGVD
tara:strand:+ start:446 stop:691 length:246 start_codon:yes stop_codon:yes gene_type:complete